MALVLDDRVKETSTTTGTGTYTLAGAVAGFQSFATIGNGNTTWYLATDGTDWEVGIGTYTTAGTTLARTTIISSSNADAAVNWAAGTRTLVCTMPSSKAFIGPASVTDNALVRFDGTGGRTVQELSGATLDDNSVLTLSTATEFFPQMKLINTTASVNAGYFLMQKSRTGGIITAGDTIATFQAKGHDGVDYIEASAIAFGSDGTPGTNDMPGKVSIYTTADGASAGTERLRINSTGRLISSTGQTAHFWVYWTANSTTILASHNIDSIADTATGDADGTITTDFSSANWAGFVSTNDTTLAWDAANTQGSGFNARAAGTFGVLCSTITDGTTAVASLTDPDQWQVVGFGVSA